MDQQATIEAKLRGRVNWSRAITDGIELAQEMVRRDVEVTKEHVMFALLCEAARVSACYSAPPRTGFPGKSSMPDAPDEISYWAQIAAYLRGEVQEIVTDRPKFTPSAEQHTRAEAILEIWHKHALARKGNRSRIKKAVWLKACGVASKKVVMKTGLSKQAIHRGQQEAMRDMYERIATG